MEVDASLRCSTEVDGGKGVCTASSRDSMARYHHPDAHAVEDMYYCVEPRPERRAQSHFHRRLQNGGKKENSPRRARRMGFQLANGGETSRTLSVVFALVQMASYSRTDYSAHSIGFKTRVAYFQAPIAR